MKYKIYFCGSIYGGRGDVGIYQKIVKELGKYGEVLTPFVADPNITEMGTEDILNDKDIHDRDIELLKQCHVIIAEVTQPSLGVGYELGRGVALGKPIFCIYRPQPDRKLSSMVRGAKDGKQFYVEDYKLEDMPAVLEAFFKNVLRPRNDSLDWSSYEPM